jgi:hypothetical protein
MRGMRGSGHRGVARRRLRRWLLAAIGVLYAASIPWYRESGAAPQVWLGLPGWVTVALGCYVAAAILNAIAWWLAEVSDGGRDEGR